MSRPIHRSSSTLANIAVSTTSISPSACTTYSSTHPRHTSTQIWTEALHFYKARNRPHSLMAWLTKNRHPSRHPAFQTFACQVLSRPWHFELYFILVQQPRSNQFMEETLTTAKLDTEEGVDEIIEAPKILRPSIEQATIARNSWKRSVNLLVHCKPNTIRDTIRARLGPLLRFFRARRAVRQTVTCGRL
ncbi:hypothetical protein HDK90DRAFT_497754 [Phyllosticta capitalensis]|uniref:Uncharacterized protein n=1 Tax=Phyllosticta capitalensis TaxID=121624 RepID=A0ABR1YBV4_9PEZI